MFVQTAPWESHLSSKLKQKQKQLGLAVRAFFIARKVIKHAMWSLEAGHSSPLFLCVLEWAKENARAAQETKPAAQLLISLHQIWNDLSVIAVKQPEFTAAAAAADVADFSAAHCLQMLNTECSWSVTFCHFTSMGTLKIGARVFWEQAHHLIRWQFWFRFKTPWALQIITAFK